MNCSFPLDMSPELIYTSQFPERSNTSPEAAIGYAFLWNVNLLKEDKVRPCNSAKSYHQHYPSQNTTLQYL